MSQRKQPIATPPGFDPLLAGADWQPITIGLSGADVYRIVALVQPPRYLKLASGPRVAELRAERDRLRWLAERLPVPAVEGWAEEGIGTGDAWRGWLLLSEAPGVMACDPAAMAEPQRLITALAEGLRQIHRLSIVNCPFDARLDQRLAQAEWVIAQGISDEAAVAESHGVSARELLRRLRAMRPDEPASDLVFTHGDYCLPNVLLDAPDTSDICADAPFQVSAYLDWGRAGVADRHQDIAIAARSVRYNLGAEWEPRFLAAYSEVRPDPARLAWYELLDELF